MEEPTNEDFTVLPPRVTDNSPRPEDGDQHVSQEPTSSYDEEGAPE